MARTLYIHLGPAKTGTSAIQNVLRSQDNSAVIYPKTGLWADGSHHNLVLNYFQDFKRTEVVREDTVSAFERIAAEAARSNRDVIISSEALAGRKRIVEFTDSLLAHLGNGFRAEFLFVVRDHFERAASVYNQRVKDGISCEKREPDEFLVEQAAQLCHQRLLRQLRQTKIAVRVLNYHPAQDFVARFLRQLGFADDRLPDTQMRNVSLSVKALIATLAANRTAADREGRERIVAALRHIPGRFAPSEFIFGAEAAAVAEMAFARDRMYLCEEFGVVLAEPDLAARTSSFSITREEFEEIAAATSQFGPVADNILECVRKFVRPVDRGNRR